MITKNRQNNASRTLPVYNKINTIVYENIELIPITRENEIDEQNFRDKKKTIGGNSKTY